MSELQKFCLRTETSPGFYGHRPPQWISPPTDGEQAKLSPELPTPCVRATMRNDDGAAPRMSKTVRVIANRCTGTFRLSTWSIRYRRAGAWATRLGRVRELALENFSFPIATWTRAQFLTARSAARRMVTKRSGLILMLSASPARMAIPLTGGFGVACAAIEGLSRTLAGELSPQGVRVVCLRPRRIGDTLPMAPEFPEIERESHRAIQHEAASRVCLSSRTYAAKSKELVRRARSKAPPERSGESCHRQQHVSLEAVGHARAVRKIRRPAAVYTGALRSNSDPH